jgi:hypothetical protein
MRRKSLNTVKEIISKEAHFIGSSLENHLIYTKCMKGASSICGGTSVMHETLVANAKIELEL